MVPMIRSQRRDDWDKFVKTLERDKLKIDPITKAEWKEYYGKLWNEQGSKGEEGIEEERRSEGTKKT